MLKLLKAGTFAIASMALIAGASAQSLGIVAASQGSQNYANNTGIAKVLIEEGGMDARLQTFSGSGQFLPLLSVGEMDIGATTQPDLEEARFGTGSFEGNAQEDLRMLAVISTTAVGFMVRKDSDIQSIADLKDRKVTYGFASQAQVLTNIDGLLANAGLTPDDIEQVMVPSVSRGVDDFIAGNADVAFFTLRGGKAREADAAFGIRWLPVDPAEEKVAAMQEALPSSYYAELEPDPGLPGITEKQGAMVFDQTLVAGAHVSEELAYQIVKTLYEHPAEVHAAAVPLFDFAPERMAEGKNVEYHPGAIKFYKEVGIWKE